MVYRYTKCDDDLQAESHLSGKGHLVGVIAALNRAVRQGYLAKAPKVDLPKRAKSAKIMKGRAITLEEFERMLAVVPKVLDIGQEVKNEGKLAKRNAEIAARVAGWRHYLRGCGLVACA